MKMKHILNQKKSKLKTKKSKYSVSDEVLDKLVDLFRSWGIEENSWMVVTETALQRHGYHFVDKRNIGEVDILIDRRVIPWMARKGEWTCVPTRHTNWFRGLASFTRRTRCTPHILTVPFGPWKVRDIARSKWYHLPSGSRIRVEFPQHIITSRAKILLHSKMGISFRDRIPRWSIETKFLEKLARKRQDNVVLNASKYFFDTIDDLQVVHSLVESTAEVQGTGIGRVTVRGVACVIKKVKNLSMIRKGEILVAEDTNPIFLPVMRKVAAIVTDRGGLTSHAATLAREFGIPAVIGTKIATKVLKTGDRVEVDTKKGVVRKLIV